MLIKRLLAIFMCLIVVGATVRYAFTFRFFDKPLSDEQKEAFCKETSLPDGFILAASSYSFDEIKNSEESVLSNFKSGSFALELNVAFNDNGIPVLADGKEYVTDDAVTLESVFERFKNQKHLRYIINITEKIDYTKFNQTVQKFDLTDRIIISNFSVSDLDFVMKQLYSYSVCLDIPNTGDFSDKDYCREFADDIANYSPFAVRLSVDDITKELADTINESNNFSLIIDDVDSSYDMYFALSLNPGGIISKDPYKFYSILVEQDFLDYKR